MRRKDVLLDTDRLRGVAIGATDGDVGELDDLFFDDQDWCVQYLVVDTNAWLPGGKVLVAPSAFEEVDWEKPAIRVDLTREAVRESPDINTALPVTREQERDYRGFFGWPVYWGPANDFGSGLHPSAGTVSRPITPVPPEAESEQIQGPGSDQESHLFSLEDFKGFQVICEDEDTGHIAGAVIDTEHLNLRYVVVDTGSFFSGKPVLLAVSWLRLPNWTDKFVVAETTRDAIESAPEYEPERMVDRGYEQQLFEHYGKTPYWE